MSQPVMRPMLGIGPVLLAVLAFAISDVISKHLTMLYAVPLVMLLRYSVNFTVLWAVLYPRHRREIWRTNRTGLVMLRAASLVVGSLTMGRRCASCQWQKRWRSFTFRRSS